VKIIKRLQRYAMLTLLFSHGIFAYPLLGILIAGTEQLQTNALTCDQIFMGTYTRLMCQGNASKLILVDGENAKGSRASLMDLDYESVMRAIRDLSVEEKCRLALLSLLALPLDGEGLERFGDRFGSDRTEVGRRLCRISEKELIKACAALKLPPQRAIIFRHLVELWRTNQD
jgi:hypothetical protein